MNRFTTGIVTGISMAIIIMIIGLSVFYLRTQPKISYNQAKASAEKQLRLIVGSNAYSDYKKNWVELTTLQWYTRGGLLSAKRVYVVNINLTMDSNASLPSRDFEFLVNDQNANTFSALDYTVSEKHGYKTPF